jgi:S-adenosylmethionine hydrolase
LFALDTLMNPPIIALLTDFGTDDPYVGIMKAVLAEISPDSTFIDLTHQIPPGDIQRGAFALWQSSLDLPQGSVFLSVVDPGVGTVRKGIILDCGGQTFIGPDNGLFSYLLYKKKYQAWELTNLKYQLSLPSSTFHGRDIFAPAAAHAAQSISGEQFGRSVTSLNRLPDPRLFMEEKTLTGEVLSNDRFGNLFTSIGRFQKSKASNLFFDSWINNGYCEIHTQSQVIITINEQTMPLVKTFGAITDGTCAGIIGSTGLLEIVCNQGSAAEFLGLDKGDLVLFQW